MSNRNLCVWLSGILGGMVLCSGGIALPAQDGPVGREPGLANRADVLLFTDFEDSNWWKDWGERRAPANNSTMLEGTPAWSGKGKSWQVTVPKGEHGGCSLTYRFKQQTGSEPEEIYLRYYVKIDPDWKNSTDGGKFPGFGGTYGKAGWGGRPVNGTDGWSARGAFLETKEGANSTAIGYYCYHADMTGQYGSVWKFKPPLEHGRWYCVEEYCKLNTPGKDGGKGKNDGILKAWIDGQPAFEKADIRFRDVETLKIECVWVNVYHGGATPVPKEDIHLYFDNMVIARSPIGPAQAQPATPARVDVAAAKAPVKPAAAAAPALPPPPTITVSAEALREWDARLVAEISRLTKKGSQPMAYLKILGPREDQVKIAGADAKALLVEIQGNKLEYPWNRLTAHDRLNLARAFVKEGETEIHLCAAVFALADNNTDLADDHFARGQLADPEEGPNRVARARESLQKK